jgi:hypothetical protein
MADQVMSSASTRFRTAAGFPDPASAAGAYGDADFIRAVQAYRLLYPSVSGLAIFKGNEAVGLVANEVFGLLDTRPGQVGLTLNSDTPYGPVLLGLRDASGAYLDGARSYRLTVPLPVPANLFWSVTVYDARTRSQVQTSQDRALLSSLFDFGDTSGKQYIDLHFGPTPPPGRSDQWVQTRPDAGWFAYFRIYGPETAAFDRTWQLPDIQPED